MKHFRSLKTAECLELSSINVNNILNGEMEKNITGDCCYRHGRKRGMERKYTITLGEIDMEAVEGLYSDEKGIKKLDAAIVNEIDHILINLGDFSPPFEWFNIEVVEDG